MMKNTYSSVCQYLLYSLHLEVTSVLVRQDIILDSAPPGKANNIIKRVFVPLLRINNYYLTEAYFPWPSASPGGGQCPEADPRPEDAWPLTSPVQLSLSSAFNLGHHAWTWPTESLAHILAELHVFKWEKYFFNYPIGGKLPFDNFLQNTV